MRATIADHQRRVVDQALLLIDEPGGVAGDQDAWSPARRGEAADRPHRVLRCAAERRIGEGEVGIGDGRERGRRGAAHDAVDLLDPASVVGELGGPGSAVDGYGYRLGDVAGVVRVEVLVCVVGGLPGRHGFGTGTGQGRPQQRRRRGEQQGRAGQGDGDRPSHHPAGESVPAVGGVRDGRAAADRERIDARSRAAPAGTARRGSRSARRGPPPRRRRRPSSTGSAAA